MEKLLGLLINRRAEVLTLFLLVIGLGLTVTAETPQRVKWLSSSSKVVGSVYQIKENLENYFELKKVNKIHLAQKITPYKIAARQFTARGLNE